MTTNKNDPADPDGDNTGVLADAGGADTTSIPMLSGTTGHVSVELHNDDDDDDFEGDVVDDTVAMSFDSLVTGQAAPFEPAAAKTSDEVEVELETPVVARRASGVDAPQESLTTDEVFVIELPAESAESLADEIAAEAVIEADEIATDEVADDTSEIAEIVTDTGEVGVEVASAATAEPSQAAAEAKLASLTDAQPAALAADGEIEPEASVADPLVIDTVATAAHDDGVTEQIPEPQRAVAARSSHDLERVMTRHDANVMASKRLDDLSSADRETSDLLTADRLLDPHQVVRPEPEGPWRQFLYSISGHRINLGDSKKARARKALDVRIAAALPGGARFVPIVSRKGGVGKTTITTLLGMALADARDDRVIAVDANPDRGTLSERIERPSGKTVRDLVRGRERVQGYNDVSTIVARDETRLDVLASDTDPMVSEAFSDDDYRHVAEIAAHYYSIVLTDTGTGIVHSVMGATLELADQIVVVAGLSVDEARLASETLTWLESNGYESLVRNSIVVLNNARPGSPLVRQDEVEAHFRSRVRDVVRVPYDPQIAAGSAIHFRELQPETRLAARTLAAKVVEGLRALSIAA